MRILIAEDDFVSRQVLCRYLDPFGTCEVAVDGREAVRAAGKAIDAGAPYDLICLDLHMPNMNGQEALREIRHLEDVDGDGEHAKILVATAFGDVENVEQAFAGQCDGYIVKPFSRRQILEQLRAFDLID